MKKRTVALLLSLALLIGLATGGTLAYLTDKSQTVENTFTVGDINITLHETKGDMVNNDPAKRTYKIIPGVDLDKDPMVTVKAGSEACWVFIKEEVTNWPAAKVTYAIRSEWTLLPGYTNIYYRPQSSLAESGKDAVLPILVNDKVCVSSDLTKAEVNAITVDPVLKFTAAAIQQDTITEVSAAWANLPEAFRTGAIQEPPAP